LRHFLQQNSLDTIAIKEEGIPTNHHQLIFKQPTITKNHECKEMDQAPQILPH
jgi:hypothetical protein